MTHVPHETVARSVERVVKRDRQLDGAEAAGEVSADLGADADQLRAQLFCDRRQLVAAQPTQQRRTRDSCEQTHR
jgi:hypothetical protein